MFNDEKEAQLSEEARLDALLQEFLDEPDDLPREDSPAPDSADPVEEYSDAAQPPEKSGSLKGLLIADGLLLLGIAGVLAWWCVRYL